MSSVIKFRGWDKKLKRWVDPTIFGIQLDGKAISTNWLEHDLNDLVISQFTNLLDCEGREIYESDVYTWKGHEVRDGKQIRPLRTETVIWNYNKLSRLENLIEAGFYEVKVIGNKWENPELLNK